MDLKDCLQNDLHKRIKEFAEREAITLEGIFRDNLRRKFAELTAQVTIELFKQCSFLQNSQELTIVVKLPCGKGEEG